MKQFSTGRSICGKTKARWRSPLLWTRTNSRLSSEASTEGFTSANRRPTLPRSVCKPTRSIRASKPSRKRGERSLRRNIQSASGVLWQTSQIPKVTSSHSGKSQLNKSTGSGKTPFLTLGCRLELVTNDYEVSGPKSTITFKGVIAMRFMIIVKASKDSEAGVMPSEKLLAEMGKFNEELANAGVLLAGEGLHPNSKGARVRFSGDKRTVIDGTFPKPKNLSPGS